LKKLGYDYTITFCFICYMVRLGLISVAPTPWWVLLIEFFMHGPSFALCLATIVAYANVIAPLGASATVQGLVQGVSDGLGKNPYTVIYQTLSFYKKKKFQI